MKFEAHLTYPIEHAQTVKTVGESAGWKFSQIHGDALLGTKPYCYLTGYDADKFELRTKMVVTVSRLSCHGILPLREKIERIIYDTKTGLDEMVDTPPVV